MGIRKICRRQFPKAFFPEGKKVCLACSAGGHLTELLQLEKAWENRKGSLSVFWIQGARNFSLFYL